MVHNYQTAAKNHLNPVQVSELLNIDIYILNKLPSLSEPCKQRAGLPPVLYLELIKKKLVEKERYTIAAKRTWTKKKVACP